MPQVKISIQSHELIEAERQRLKAVLGRKITQAEIVERAMKALTDRNTRAELAAKQGGFGSGR